jgi:hypothetical protein
MPKSKSGLALDDKEFFNLAMVVMSAARHAWMGCEKGKLATVRRFEHLYEDPSLVRMLRQVVGE